MTILAGNISGLDGEASRRTTTGTPTLLLSQSLEKSLRQHMDIQNRRGDESAAFLLCERVEGGTTGGRRYLVRRWEVPESGDYTIRSATGLTLAPEAHRRLLAQALASGLHPVHLHTHPGAALPRFSGVDDLFEQSYAASLKHIVPKLDLLSGVYNSSMTNSTFRIWTEGVEQPLTVQRGWPDFAADKISSAGEESFSRQAIFGDGFRNTLASLRVGVVGLGGIGAVFVELLSRLGVRNWVLVDPDRLDSSNLNRAPFATGYMARIRLPKVRHAENLIRRLWKDEATVVAIKGELPDPEPMEALRDIDILVAATDTHNSRLVAMKVALGLGVPLLSIGTFIDLNEKNGLRAFGRVTMPPVAGGWCLVCCGAISLQQASIENADAGTQAHLRQGGYMSEIPDPSVYWVNATTAGAAVGLIHKTVMGITPAVGVDDILDLASGEWLHLEPEMSIVCFTCGVEGRLGMQSE